MPTTMQESVIVVYRTLLSLIQELLHLFYKEPDRKCIEPFKVCLHY